MALVKLVLRVGLTVYNSPMKKHIFTSLFAVLFLLSACGAKPSTDPNNEEEEETTQTQIVSFYSLTENATFTGSLDLTTTQENFVTWFNTSGDLLSSINVTGYAQMNSFGDFVTLCIGSGSSNGKIDFNFKYDVRKIKLNVSAYSKYDSFNQVYRTDLDTAVYIDSVSNEFPLVSEDGVEPNKSDIEYIYENETKNISIFNKELDHSRIFIHSMEVTYIIEK